MVKVGVIAALDEEADPFFFERGLRTEADPFPFRRLKADGSIVVICVSGIGKVNSAMAATLLIVEEKCDLLLSIGTAGLVGEHRERCFWISSAVQHDYGAERSDGFTHYTAGAWPIGPACIEPYLSMPDPGRGLPHARVASGDAFIESPDHSRLLAGGLSSDLVEMETAAIAQVAARFGIPWAGIRAVSDSADGNSAGDFQSNLRRASLVAAEAAERLVGLITDRLPFD